ncbi:Hypothetical protein DEACI_3652 [Acididesulfobacillus acetoxydans]|uniref:Uncharacterized protein n=1 Tax=Acididesulfobacillus acetoxydans TaxID=1561005 RepID=A0A8S0W9S0_9FIRM|nr:Hypothetical protein DEACI_3652 [Acididesulfobacillus acetoxydans]CEJ05710.1 Hypothetical protein DEACI_0129 [Acididesulfobacillus acetoxydans]
MSSQRMNIPQRGYLCRVRRTQREAGTWKARPSSRSETHWTRIFQYLEGKYLFFGEHLEHLEEKCSFTEKYMKIGSIVGRVSVSSRVAVRS